MQILQEQSLIQILRQAHRIFNQKHAHLLKVCSSERSITHAIANCLAEALQDNNLDNLDIDCEYSRNGEEVKRLNLKTDCTNSDDLVAKTVYPDIIVHKRGSNEDNVMYIEVKIEENETDKLKEHDIDKINAAIKEFKYQFGLYILINMEQWEVRIFPKEQDVTFSTPQPT